MTQPRLPWTAAAAVLLSLPAGAQKRLFDVKAYGDSDWLGRSVAAAGDADQDGRADVLVGAPQSLFAPGYARLVSGASGQDLLLVPGPQMNSEFGAAVAGVGDQDGDGVPDFAAGAPVEDKRSEFFTTNSGAVRTYSGASGALLQGWIGQPDDTLGHEVAAVGDVDGDGRDDLLVAGGMLAWPPAAGFARVLSGADGSTLLAVSGSPGAAFGFSARGPGDVDADGVPDIVVGAWTESTPALAGCGAARAFSGASGAVLLELFGGQAHGGFGWAVSGAGDADHDGRADVLVGAPRETSSAGHALAGAARVFSGAGGGVLHAFEGAAAGTFLGRSVALAGDADLDGFDDWAIGTELDSVLVRSGQAGALLATLAGPSDFGAAVAGAGDVDADGLPDLVVGAPEAGPGSSFAWLGSAHVFSLVPAGIAAYGTGTPGCSGAHVATASAIPALGTAGFELRCAGAPPSAHGLALLSDQPAPGSGDPFGLGIELEVEVLSAGLLLQAGAHSDAAGFGAAALPIPAVPALAGLELFAQSFWPWPSGPCSPSVSALSATPGLRIELQL